MKAHETARVIAPPPLIAAATLVLALLLELLWPSSGLVRLGMPVRLLGGGLLLASGIAVAASGERRFHVSGTAVRPWKPATALVTTGIYAHLRNPMYVGVALALLGVAVGFDSLWLLVLLVPFGLLIHYGVVLREERYLERIFGDDYRAFKARVPRYGWPPAF
jgi:protein-S-isoprenylcysteine O-methyltransferase Ste14